MQRLWLLILCNTHKTSSSITCCALEHALNAIGLTLVSSYLMVGQEQLQLTLPLYPSDYQHFINTIHYLMCKYSFSEEVHYEKFLKVSATNLTVPFYHYPSSLLFLVCINVTICAKLCP